MIYKYFRDNKVQVKGAIHVGAHRGEEIYDYEKLGAKKVVWIEPNPDVFEELVCFLENAETSVESTGFCVAAGNGDEDEIDFHICYGPDAGYMVGNKGCSSLLKPGSEQMKEWHQKTIKVEVAKLDSIITDNELLFEDYQILDMDTQGAELMVLQGANEVLNHVKYVTTEATWNNPDYEGGVMFDELTEYLGKRGFKHVETFKHTEDWGDALFVKED